MPRWGMRCAVGPLRAHGHPDCTGLILRQAMSVHDVRRARWAAVLEQFSRTHHGWLASLVRVYHGSTLAYHTGWYPLAFVTAEEGPTGATTIRIGFQGGPTVTVGAPRALGIDTRADGAERALEIEAARGDFVRLAFRATARPEEMNGVAPAEVAEPFESG